MVMCQYFLQGRCRYGQNCRFEHSYNSYQDDRGNRNANAGGNTQANNIACQIAKEVIAAEKGGQWPLSCFSPFKEGPCLPDWDDVSPEELRWTLYEAQKNGTVTQCLNRISQLHSSAERARNLLKQPTSDTVRMINDILSGKKTLPPSNNSNNFANTPLPARSNPFETNNSFRFDPAAANTNIFGGSSPPNYSNQNIFGNADSPSQNIFSNSQQSNQNIFSNPNQNAFSSTNQNIFSTPQSSPSSTNQNIFSTPPNQSSTTNQNLFSTPQSPSGANQNIFSNTQPTNQNIFSTPTNVFNSNNSSFSGSNPIFGRGTQPNENFGNVFGGSQSNPQTQNPGFSQDQPGFANYQAASNSNAYGNQTETNQVQPVNFGQVVQTDSSSYSNADDLTEEEKTAFTSPTFAFGKIPMKPPAQQYC